jgi:hypothetical protein
MLRRLTLVITALAVAVVGIAPSHAAAPKKKKPNITGHYDVKLTPDPTQDVMTNVKDGCNGLTGKGTDNHPFTVPAAGKLTVSLVSPDPTNKGVTDWALWLMDKDGVAIAHSDSAGSNEQTPDVVFKKKQSFVIQVCNIAGQQDGHVSFVFKYA